MDFEKRLEKAIARGSKAKEAEGRQQAEKALTEEDFRTLHSQARLQVTEHIEKCLKQVADHFPGFQYSTIMSEDGWGGRIARDNLSMGAGRSPQKLYSRLEMLIRPFSKAHLIDLAAKGTIKNKELFNRSHFQKLSELDVDSFSEMVDLWVLEFAENYSASEG